MGVLPWATSIFTCQSIVKMKGRMTADRENRGRKRGCISFSAVLGGFFERFLCNPNSGDVGGR